MSTQLVPIRKDASDRHWDGLDHWYCCNENQALCGADITNAPEVNDMPNLCVVCDDLEKNDCERCGE